LCGICRIRRAKVVTLYKKFLRRARCNKNNRFKCGALRKVIVFQVFMVFSFRGRALCAGGRI